MEASEDRKRKMVCESTVTCQDKYEDDVMNPVAKKFKDIPEEPAGFSTGALKKDNEVKLKPGIECPKNVISHWMLEPYDLSENDDDEENIFGAVKNNTDELCITEYRSSSSSVLGDFDQTSLLHTQGFSCFLNEDGDVVLDQISASFSNNYSHDEFLIQPIIQEASPESPPSIFSPPYTPIARLETIPAVSNRKIPTSSWYSLIQDALDNMDGEATAREMVEYFEKNHKAHPFMKKTHWKQTVYTYLSKYFEKKFVGGSRDTIYTYTRTSANSDPIGEAKAIARKKTKKSSPRVNGTVNGAVDSTISVNGYPRITRRIQNQLADSMMQTGYGIMLPRVPPIK